MKSKTVQHIKTQLELQNKLFANVLRNIWEVDAKFGLDEHTCSVKWIAGHIVNIRMILSDILSGAEHDSVYAQLFGKGTSTINTETYPTIDEIILKWEVISNELSEKINNLTEEKLAEKMQFYNSLDDNTLLGLIAFIIIHEAHHIGQISALRKISEENANEDLILYENIICN